MKGHVTRLDWAIVGWQADGKHIVFASDMLSQGELEVITSTEIEDPFAFIQRHVPHSHTFTLTVRSRSLRHGTEGALYVMAWGDTYEEALRKLMEVWRPSPRSEEARELVRRSITPEAYAELAAAVDPEFDL